ncbi:MAG: pilus assembly protein TadG-related protein [Planctomycetaceae bacterium]
MKTSIAHAVLGSRRVCRRGSILVLAAVLMIVILAFTAFTVDIGYIAVTKAQLQNASDAAAMSAAAELPYGWGPGATYNESETASASRTAAQDVAALNPAGGLDSVYVNGQRDLRLGQAVWDSATNTWTKTWGVSPYNLVEVVARRDQGSSANGDGSLNLFFAPVIGHDTATLTTTSICAMPPAVGFRTPGNGQTVGVLPIALDVETWDAMIAGSGPDTYSYNESTGAVVSGSDGIREVNLYPNGTTALPPGNRGTVDFGPSNNSTSDLSRQICNGLNASDLSYFGGELRFDQVPLVLNGDTGLSAGIKDDLTSIKGIPRAIPLFSQVSGPGNNAMYTIVRFVGIRILDVKLTGGSKYVMVQPAPLVDSNTIPGTGSITSDTIFGPPALIQ